MNSTGKTKKKKIILSPKIHIFKTRVPNKITFGVPFSFYGEYH